jgi:hypothetical protein
MLVFREFIKKKYAAKSIDVSEKVFNVSIRMETVI